MKIRSTGLYDPRTITNHTTAAPTGTVRYFEMPKMPMPLAIPANSAAMLPRSASPNTTMVDRKSTRLNSSHADIYTLSLHDALPIWHREVLRDAEDAHAAGDTGDLRRDVAQIGQPQHHHGRSEEHTSELQSRRYLHSFPTRRSSDLAP